MRKKVVTPLNAGLIGAATFFFGLAFFSATPGSLATNAQDTLAAVGVSVGVAPNQYNTVAQQLSDKSAQLDAQQAQIDAERSAQSRGDRLGFYSLCISAALFLLVAVNFYFDVRRRSGGARTAPFSVDLR